MKNGSFCSQVCLVKAYFEYILAPFRCDPLYVVLYVTYM